MALCQEGLIWRVAKRNLNFSSDVGEDISYNSDYFAGFDMLIFSSGSSLSLTLTLTFFAIFSLVILVLEFVSLLLSGTALLSMGLVSSGQKEVYPLTSVDHLGRGQSFRTSQTRAARKTK